MHALSVLRVRVLDEGCCGFLARALTARLAVSVWACCCQVGSYGWQEALDDYDDADWLSVMLLVVIDNSSSSSGSRECY